ncbi:helicase [Bdellovibrio sp. HCB288]|uniref:helicase n=1 Tax=Bdellovibrio sp. HCB288 TaxID=3394355 RepID=UPI0039B619A3
MRSFIALLILINLGFASHSVANELHDFTSDGCSRSPDGIWTDDAEAFLDCCIKHDVAYWRGGTSEERLHADEDLKVCIQKKGYPKVAEAYYYAVRMGGHPMFHTSYRWGYGWQTDRGYAPLSFADWELVIQKIIKAKTEGIVIN